MGEDRRMRRRGCRRNRSQQHGGTAGNSYTLGPSVDLANPSLGAARVDSFSSCQSAGRPGYISDAQIKGGLPGFGGGGRRTYRNGPPPRKSTLRHKQRGGTYSLTGAELVGGIAYSPREYTGCGAGQYATPNPLNPPGSATPLTAPLQAGGVGGVASMAYTVPRAGYAIMPDQGSKIYDGVTGYEGRIGYSGTPYPSSACLKTGGRRSRRASRKNRKNRKSKKVNRNRR